MSAPGVLEAQLQWDQLERQRAVQEQARVEAGAPFFYEPYHFDWCAFITAKTPPVENSTTGASIRIYAICSRENPDSNCEFFVERGH